MFAVDKIERGYIFLTILSANVKAPNIFLIGHFKTTFVSSTVFNESCINCIFSNSISALKPGMTVMVFYQPAFVLLPVSIRELWNYNNKLQTPEEVSQDESRNKSVLSLMIRTGIAVLIILIASTSVSVTVLTQEVKTDTFVNHFTKNITNNLSIQEVLDRLWKNELMFFIIIFKLLEWMFRE